jgi:DeoR/GlpR family transcriptional regulator of sugar metabolism
MHAYDPNRSIFDSSTTAISVPSNRKFSRSGFATFSPLTDTYIVFDDEYAPVTNKDEENSHPMMILCLNIKISLR